MPKIITDDKKIGRLLGRGVAEVLSKEHLKTKLLSGKRLRIKFGIDPTSPELHLGHAVPLRKLKEFQDLGHQAVLIIGDFTAAIGDPSGREKSRPPLSGKKVEENLKSYLKQAGRVIDVKKTEIHRNSRWHEKEGLKTILSLARAVSVQQLLRRKDFRGRIKGGGDLSLLEFLYPLFQAYDSVKTRADVEIGGTDQKFNLIMGRRVQRHFGAEEQDIMTLPLLLGTDGKKKMSKSLNNHIALADGAGEMFGRIMAIPDTLISDYFKLLTDLEPPKAGPRESKIALAETIVGIYHGAPAAAGAKEDFSRVFEKRLAPEKIREVKLPKDAKNLKELVFKSGLAGSLAEAQRLIEQGAVSLDGRAAAFWSEKPELKKPAVLKVGKRKFVRLVP